MLTGSSTLLVQAPVDFLAAARRYIKSRTKQYTALDVDFIVNLYADVCAAGSVDVEFAITQMIHETGALTSLWSSPTRRNPAGIGVTGANGPDGQPLGLVFDSWADAVEAHIGLILCYRFPAGQGSPAQQRLINEMLTHRPGAPRGVATNVAELAVKWAADPEYVTRLSAMHAAVEKA